MCSNCVNAAVPPYLALFRLPNGTISGNTGTNNFNQHRQQRRLLYHPSGPQLLAEGLTARHVALRHRKPGCADTTDTLYDEAISRRTTASLEEVHIFTPRLANSFRLGYNRSVAIAPNEKYAYQYRSQQSCS